MSRRTFVLIAVFVTSLAWAARAQALPLRTFVSKTGDDVNNCSVNSPCLTLSGAIAKTAVGGAITALNSGGFGPVNITTALTIQAAAGAHALVPAVEILAGQTDVVVLRNLQISRVNHTHGIKYNSGGTLHVENCVISGFPGSGIQFVPSIFTFSQLFVIDTILRDNGLGINLFTVIATIDRCRIANNGNGVEIKDRTTLTIRDSVVAGSTSGYGFDAVGGISTTNVENCVVTNNQTGIRASTAPNPDGFYFSNTMILANVTPLVPNGGELISFGNNRITNGAFTATLPQQ